MGIHQAAEKNEDRQTKARRGKARQGKTRQGMARQGEVRHDKPRQGKSRQPQTRQVKARQAQYAMHLLVVGDKLAQVRQEVTKSGRDPPRRKQKHPLLVAVRPVRGKLHHLPPPFLPLLNTASLISVLSPSSSSTLPSPRLLESGRGRKLSAFFYAVIRMRESPPHKRLLVVGCGSPSFMRLAQHLEALCTWCKQCLPGR